MTLPAGTVLLDAVVTAPTISEALVIAVDAAPCVRPMTLGTEACAGPDDTTSATELPLATCVPPAGFWLITDPAGTIALAELVIVPTLRPAFVIDVVAAACVKPTTFGTAICGGPDETTSATVVPVATCVAAAGF